MLFRCLGSYFRFSAHPAAAIICVHRIPCFVSCVICVTGRRVRPLAQVQERGRGRRRWRSVCKLARSLACPLMRRTDLLLARIIFRLHAFENESENEKGPGTSDVISEGESRKMTKGSRMAGCVDCPQTYFTIMRAILDLQKCQLIQIALKCVTVTGGPGRSVPDGNTSCHSHQ